VRDELRIFDKLFFGRYKDINKAIDVYKLYFQLFSLNLISQFNKNNFTKKQLDLINSLDVWIVSPGGSGSTDLMLYLNKFFKTNSPKDQDLLKHKSSIPQCLDKNVKILFVYRDKEEIYDSLVRRNILRKQNYKLGAIMPFKSYKLFSKLYDKQNLNFFNFIHKNKILYLKYPDFYNDKTKIVKFLGLANSYIDSFPVFEKNKEQIDQD
jgi:hypothetical protein